jgi:hypothetical protein
MTTLIEPPTQVDPADETDERALGGYGDEPLAEAEALEAAEADAAEVGRPGYVALSAAASTLGAAWLAAHLFHSVTGPFLCAALGVGIGAGLVWLSTRFERRSLLQFAVLPALALAGAALTTTAPGGNGGLPSLIERTIRAGGLRNPPVPFDPGWRFLVVVLFGLIAAAATTAALSFARPKLGVGLPALVTLAVALLQPKDGGLGATVGAVVLVVAGLALAFGADLAKQVSTGVGFEARRLLRGAVLLSVAVAVLVGIAQSSFLFPSTDKNNVIPPRKPPSAAALPPHQLLFSVRSEAPGPWRLGVLDSYGDGGFLLPSVDPARLRPLNTNGVVAPAPHPSGKPPGKRYSATITIATLAGQTLPGPPQLESVNGVTAKAGYDPETELVSLTDISVRSGMTYTTTAPALPTGRQLQHVRVPYPAAMQAYTELPPPPRSVVDLIAKAPKRDNFDKLQFLRSKLLDNVVASGSGRPIDIAPSRVPQMLAGGKGTPYEIVAAQVMLARWAGIPARIGYGFYGGTRSHDPGSRDLTTFAPIDGAAWLEANFPGYGWVPIIGTPRKAQPSLSEDPKQQTKIPPTDQLALSLYIPVRTVSVRLLYEQVRYYAWRVLAIGGGLIALIVCYPALFKLIRRWRRRRWASGYGGNGRAIAAYAEFRDRCYDLNIGDPRLTPLEFVTAIEADAEHEELAWLVTRVVWGDLRRDLQDDDLDAVEEMARSVGRRVTQQQPGTNRFVAAITRTSLRDPWTTEIPNFWRPRRKQRRVRSGRRLRRTLSVLTAGLVASGCAGGHTSGTVPPVTYPASITPAVVNGYDVTEQPEQTKAFQSGGKDSLIQSGKLFSIRKGATVEGALQVTLFRDDVNAQDPKVQSGIEKGLGAGGRGFQTLHLGLVRLQALSTGETNLYLWFPPEHNVMELFVLRSKFTEGEALVRTVVAHQLGLDLAVSGTEGSES